MAPSSVPIGSVWEAKKGRNGAHDGIFIKVLKANHVAVQCYWKGRRRKNSEYKRWTIRIADFLWKYRRIS